MRRLALALLAVTSLLVSAASASTEIRGELDPDAKIKEADRPEADATDDENALESKTLVAFVHQTRSVRSSCLTGDLRVLLRKLRDKFGREVVLTSGYRPPGRARPGSYHRRCMAADIQIPGVAPSRVARAARAIPGIGGVGTYCHTRSVHVDVGPRRDWHWTCRKKKKRR